MRAVAVVKDLFFVARIRETARMVGTPLTFARTSDDLTATLTEPTDLVIMDLTSGDFDYDALFGALDAATPRPSVLGFTTHALARATQPLHARCTRVVTKETLTQDLPRILAPGAAA